MKKSFIYLVLIASLSTILIVFIIKEMKEERPKVVVVLKELDTQYWEIVKAGAEKGFRDFGLEGRVMAPSYKSEITQEDMLNNILLEKPDAVVVAPIESPKTISILEQFTDRKIPVVLLDTNVPLQNKTSYIGTDNYELGKKAGALLAFELQPGDEVALIAGHITSSVIGERVKGAKASLKEVGIKIAAEKVNLSNEPIPVKKAIREIVLTHPNVKGVFATTDIMALSAFEVLEEQGYNIPVIGADGIIEMVELVEDGKISGTVAQNPYDMGYLSAQAAMNAAKGKNVDTNIDSGIDIIVKGNGQERLSLLQKVIK